VAKRIEITVTKLIILLLPTFVQSALKMKPNDFADSWTCTHACTRTYTSV